MATEAAGWVHFDLNRAWAPAFTEKFLLEPKIERHAFNFGLLRSVRMIAGIPCLDSRAGILRWCVEI